MKRKLFYLIAYVFLIPPLFAANAHQRQPFPHHETQKFFFLLEKSRCCLCHEALHEYGVSNSAIRLYDFLYSDINETRECFAHCRCFVDYAGRLIRDFSGDFPEYFGIKPLLGAAEIAFDDSNHHLVSLVTRAYAAEKRIYAGLKRAIAKKWTNLALSLISLPSINKVAFITNQNFNGVSLLMRAIRQGMLPVVRYFFELLEENGESPADFLFDMNNDDQNCLHLAALSNSSEMLQYLLAFPIEWRLIAVDQDIFGCAPLHYAASTSSRNVVGLLLRIPGLNINLALAMRDGNGLIPLHCAVIANNVAAAATLLDFDIYPHRSLNTKNAAGTRPIDFIRTPEMSQRLADYTMNVVSR